MGSFERLAQEGGVAAHVELLLDEPPGAAREPDAQLGVGEQPFDSIGEGGGVALGDHQARLPVAQHLGDAGNVRRDAGRAQGHRLQENGRQAVAVAVSSDDAGGGEDRRAPDGFDQLALRTGAG